MAKRFTETNKWTDRWFVSLPGEYKLAWQYICDQCDHAGVLEVVEPVANIQIGFDIDWDDFVEHCAHRVVKLEEGKFWVKAFIEFQYGELNPDNRVHASVISRLKKLGLTRALEAPSKGLKNKDKDKDKDLKKENEWQIPERLDTPQVRELLDDFAAMRREIKKPIRNVANTSKGLEKFDDVPHLVHALELCIANEWQGLKPEYRPESQPKKKEMVRL